MLLMMSLWVALSLFVSLKDEIPEGEISLGCHDSPLIGYLLLRSPTTSFAVHISTYAGAVEFEEFQDVPFPKYTSSVTYD